nr:MAG TPA: hypothetical protein [Caudoviricetes sp.]
MRLRIKRLSLLKSKWIMRQHFRNRKMMLQWNVKS